MILRAALLVLALAVPAQGQTTGFDQVHPILTQHCTRCHSGPSAPMGLDLTSFDAVLSGGWSSTVVEAGNADSALLRRIRGDITPRMPLNGPPYLTDAEIATLTAWVTGGLAKGAPVTVVAEAPRPKSDEPVLWTHVQPILDRACIKCHSDNSKLGAPPEDLRLTTLAQVLQGGERLVILPGNPQMSPLWRHITGTALPLMPHDGPPWLAEEDIRLITDWIAQGAPDADGTPAPIPAGANLRLRGTLTGPSAIDGAEFTIDSRTRIDDRPRIGGQAEMRGVVQPDGSVLATRFRDR